MFSRRKILGTLAVSSAVSIGAFASNASDEPLLVLGEEFDEVARLVDVKIDDDSDGIYNALDRLKELVTEIEARQATTMEGLFVKSRLACWSLLGDLDTPEDATLDQRMAYSMLRDLIRLHRPDLEQPGAIKKMITEIENGASQRS